MRRADERCAALGRLAGELDPQRLLRRGFSITRRADGSLLRDAAQAAGGERLVTRLSVGELTSRVEEP
jgi:exodeoxyribonuclease VII large subunit